MNRIEEYTNSKLVEWYANAKKDYWIEGSAVCKKVGLRTYHVESIECGQKHTKTIILWDVQDLSYVYDVWAESYEVVQGSAMNHSVKYRVVYEGIKKAVEQFNDENIEYIQGNYYGFCTNINQIISEMDKGFIIDKVYYLDSQKKIVIMEDMPF